jgi:simple sugar transport system ATP-binding protein
LPETAVPPCAVSVRDVTKSFGHVQALRGASLEARAGEVLVVFGDNGAGKSTLMNVIAGVHQPDSGQLMIGGEESSGATIAHAQQLGVQTVFQDLALAPDLSVAENMFLGHELVRRGRLLPLLTLDRAKMVEIATDALKQLSIQLPNAAVPVSMLSGGQRQAVAVARAVMWARLVVLMDEPTAALGARQSDIVCDTIRATAARGLAVIVVSHDILRMLATADRVAIMRQGQIVHDGPTDELSVRDVVAIMVGQEDDGATG